MEAPTHLTFSILSLATASALIGHALTPAEAAWAAAGALLPDVDTPTSLVGKVCPPLSQSLERRWGHREVTHSLVAAAILGLIAVPPALLTGYVGWAMALIVGYLSHLLLDANTKTGVKLFHPSPVRGVLPGNENLRIASGSTQERLLCVAFVVGLMIFLPINVVGIKPALHRVLQTTSAAISDYRAWGGEQRVFAQVEGRFQVSQRPITGVFEVLGIANANLLVVYDRANGVAYSVGAHREANIYPQRIYCFKGQQMTVTVKELVLENQLLTEVLAHLPTDGETFIEGEVKTVDQVVITQPPDVFPTVESGVKRLQLRHARPEDLRKPELEGVFVTEGHLYARTIHLAHQEKGTRPRSETAHIAKSRSAAVPVVAAPTKPTPSELVGVVDLYLHKIRDMEREVLVARGEPVTKGQLIAVLTYRDQELKRRDQAITDAVTMAEARVVEALAAERREHQGVELEIVKARIEVDRRRHDFEVALRLHRVGAASAAHVADRRLHLQVAEEQLRLARLSAETATRAWVTKIQQARAAVAETRRQEESLRDEQKAIRIRAPADGKVLLVRPHVVNGQDMTVLIKLLVRRASDHHAPTGTATPEEVMPPLGESATAVAYLRPAEGG